MKKIFIFSLVIVMCIGLTACENNKEDEKMSNKSVVTSNDILTENDNVIGVWTNDCGDSFLLKEDGKFINSTKNDNVILSENWSINKDILTVKLNYRYTIQYKLFKENGVLYLEYLGIDDETYVIGPEYKAAFQKLQKQDD